MNQRQVLELTSRILSLYFLVQAVGFLRDIILYGGIQGVLNYEESSGLWIMFVSLIINLITNLFFFWFFAFKSNLVVKTVFRKDDNYNLSISLDKKDLLEISIAVIGVIAIVFSVPQVLNMVVDSIYFQRNPDGFTNDRVSLSDFLYSIFKIVVGIASILYSRQISKMIIRRGEKDDAFDKVME